MRREQEAGGGMRREQEAGGGEEEWRRERIQI